MAALQAAAGEGAHRYPPVLLVLFASKVVVSLGGAVYFTLYASAWLIERTLCIDNDASCNENDQLAHGQAALRLLIFVLLQMAGVRGVMDAVLGIAKGKQGLSAVGYVRRVFAASKDAAADAQDEVEMTSVDRSDKSSKAGSHGGRGKNSRTGSVARATTPREAIDEVSSSKAVGGPTGRRLSADSAGGYEVSAIMRLDTASPSPLTA